MKTYREHIKDTIRSIPTWRSKTTEVGCPRCKGLIERGTVWRTEGGNLLRTLAFCRFCGWVGSYFKKREE